MFLNRRSSFSLKVWAILVLRIEVNKFLLKARGGFAGTIQAFVKNDFVCTYKEKIEEVFGPDSCYILKIRPEGSVKII